MQLEDQVCSLELAKRLKELGVRQESLCYWIPIRKMVFGGHCPLTGDYEKIPSFEKEDQESLCAFSVAELGEMLPEEYITMRIGQFWDCIRFVSQVKAFDINTLRKDDTEANARAKMLIRLIEQGIVKP